MRKYWFYVKNDFANFHFYHPRALEFCAAQICENWILKKLATIYELEKYPTWRIDDGCYLKKNYYDQKYQPYKVQVRSLKTLRC